MGSRERFVTGDLVDLVCPTSLQTAVVNKVVFSQRYGDIECDRDIAT